MTVAPEIQNMLDLLGQIEFAGLHTLTPAEARSLMASMPRSNEHAEVASVSNHSFEHSRGRNDSGGDPVDVPVRLYLPEGEGPFPVLIWIHGGGFVVGGLDGVDGTCRELCAGVHVAVVSVDYRLAPEHPFPAAPDDCIAALDWVVAGGLGEVADLTTIFVGGDSAGGNLAAVVAIAARDAGIQLAHQVLVYPATDLRMRHPSIAENGEGFLLSEADMHWFMDAYLPESARADPMASPLLADDLTGVAPATVITAWYDPLRDEGAEYAMRLGESGVDVEHACYRDMIHGFFGMTAAVQSARDARDLVVARLRSALV